MLERADAIGASWRGRYDRLRLNTSRWFSKLPGGSYAPGTGVFPTRDEVVSYLEDYARDNALDVRLRTRVERIDPDGAGWVVRTSAGDVPAEHVVVAAGYEHTPFVPDWPGRDRFRGALLHAAEYRNPEPFRDRDVLVVGPGCSGMEIAYDLAEGGARKVRLAVRTPPNILIRSPMGPAFALALMRVRPQRADRVVNFVRSKEVGDLTEFGLPVPEEGTFSRLRRLGVAPAIVDKVVIEAIRERRIEIVAEHRVARRDRRRSRRRRAHRARRGHRRDRLPQRPRADGRPPRRARRRGHAARIRRRGRRARPAVRRLPAHPGADALRGARGQAGGEGHRRRAARAARRGAAGGRARGRCGSAGLNPAARG